MRRQVPANMAFSISDAFSLPSTVKSPAVTYVCISGNSNLHTFTQNRAQQVILLFQLSNKHAVVQLVFGLIYLSLQQTQLITYTVRINFHISSYKNKFIRKEYFRQQLTTEGISFTNVSHTKQAYSPHIFLQTSFTAVRVQNTIYIHGTEYIEYIHGTELTT